MIDTVKLLKEFLGFSIDTIAQKCIRNLILLQLPAIPISSLIVGFDGQSGGRL